MSDKSVTVPHNPPNTDPADVHPADAEQKVAAEPSVFKRPWRKHLLWLVLSHAGLAILIFLGTLFFTIGKHRWVTYKNFHKLWDVLLASKDSNTRVVIGALKLKEIAVGDPPGPVQLPKNVFVVADEDAIAAAELRAVLVREYSDRNIELRVAEEAVDIRDNTILVGGGSVNKITKNFLPQLSKQVAIVYPDHYALYAGQRYDAKKNGDGEISEDYGFIVIGPNPHDSTKKVCLVFGIWPQGTYAAIEALTRPEILNSPHGKELVQKLLTRGSLVARVNTKVLGYARGKPEIEDVSDLVQH